MAPMQIRSFAEAREWLSFCLRENPEGRPNFVRLRDGIVLRWNEFHDIHSSTTFLRWQILNDRGEILACNRSSLWKTMDLASMDENAHVTELWRACAAWGPGAA